MKKKIKTKAGPAGPASPATRCILTLNAGSSSVKFALYRADSPDSKLLSGRLERIGLPKPLLTTSDDAGKKESGVISAPSHHAAGEFLIKWLERRVGFNNVAGVGH